jgi:hypothetical protein
LGGYPYFRSVKEAERGYLAVGKIALNWGAVELGIEGCLIFIRNRLRYGLSENNDGLWSTKFPFPFAFSGKIKEMNRHVATEQVLKPVAQKVGPLLARCKTVHDCRSKIVHSHCNGSGDDGRLIFGKSDPRNGIAYMGFEMSIEELEALANQMLPLQDEVEQLGKDLRSINFDG